MTWKASILNATQEEEQEVTGNAAEAVVVALARRAMIRSPNSSGFGVNH